MYSIFTDSCIAYVEMERELNGSRINVNSTLIDSNYYAYFKMSDFQFKTFIPDTTGKLILNPVYANGEYEPNKVIKTSNFFSSDYVSHKSSFNRRKNKSKWHASIDFSRVYSDSISYHSTAFINYDDEVDSRFLMRVAFIRFNNLNDLSDNCFTNEIIPLWQCD